MPDQAERLKSLGIELPEMAAPVANYLPYSKTGNLLFIAGQISRTKDGSNLRGKLGQDMDVEEGYDAADWSRGTVELTLSSTRGSNPGFLIVVHRGIGGTDSVSD